MTSATPARSFALACLLWAAGAHVAGAQTAPLETAHLTLAQAEAEATAHAPQVAAAGARARAAQLQATSAARVRLGRVDAVASVARYQDDVMLRPISGELFASGGFAGLPFDRTQAHYGLTFQVPLYLGGRLSAAADLATLQADGLGLAAEGTRWQVRANATALYATVQTLDEVVRAIDRDLEALGATRRSLGLMVEQGRRPALDRLKLDEEIESARAERSHVTADAARARALLLALVGRDPSAGLDVDPLPDVPPRPIPSLADVQAMALGATPVRRAEVAAARAARAIDLEKAKSRPNLVARGDWMGHAGPSVAALSTWDVSIGVSVALFDGARRAGVAAAREEACAADSALSEARLTAVAEAVAARAALLSAQEELRAAGARVAAAAEAARIEQLKYDTGAGTIEDLLRARARDMGSRAALARARGGDITAAARLNAAVEREIVP